MSHNDTGGGSGGETSSFFVLLGGFGCGGMHIVRPTAGGLLDSHPLTCTQTVELPTAPRTTRVDNASQHGHWSHHGNPLVDLMPLGPATSPMPMHTDVVSTDQ